MSAAQKTTEISSSLELINGGSETCKNARELMAMQWLNDQGLEGVLSVKEVLSVSALSALVDELIKQKRANEEAIKVVLKQAAFAKLKAAMAAELGHTVEDQTEVEPEPEQAPIVVEVSAAPEQKHEVPLVSEQELQAREWERQDRVRADIENMYGKGFLPDYVWDGNSHNEAQYCASAMRGVLISLIRPGQHKLRELSAKGTLSKFEEMLLKDVQAYCDFFQRYLDALKEVLCEYHGWSSSGYLKAPRKLFIVVDRELKRDKRFKAHLKLPTLKSVKVKMAVVDRELERKTLQAAIRSELNKHATNSQKGLCKSIAKAAMAYLQDGMDLEACLRDMLEHYLKGLPEKLPHARLAMLASGTATDESEVTARFMVIMQSMMDEHAFGAARIIANFIKMSDSEFVDALKERALEISFDDMEKGLPLWIHAGGDEESFLTALTERC